MTVVISGTNGIQNVLGSAAAPSNTNGSSTNTGVYFPTSTTLGIATAGTNAVYVDASQNVGIGTSSPAFKIHTESSTPAYFGTNSTSGTIVGYASALPSNSVSCFVGWIPDTIGTLGINGDLALCPRTSSTANIRFFTGSTSATERMRIDSSGNLLVGTTSAAGKATFTETSTQNTLVAQNATFDYFTIASHNKATSGDNRFVTFGTEASFTARGSITYNRAGGLTVYNTTSDYRAKDIYGPITDSGTLIDSVPVYMGKMKYATQERPMFIAHETPAYAHTGEKDAVDADGNPVYQQMDASALIPVMWAEIQSLRKRLTALEAV